MCIYCTTNNYRKIYENHKGKIPKQPNGRSFQIHHKDGDHNNNSPENLVAITIQEHYKIHYAQGDFGACALLAKSMKLPTLQISALTREFNLTRVRNKTHPFLTRPDGSSLSKDRVKNGTNPFLTRKDGTNINTDRVVNGTHHLLTRKDGTSISSDRVKSGKHNFLTDNPGKIQLSCLKCRKVGGICGMRQHLKKCN